MPLPWSSLISPALVFWLTASVCAQVVPANESGQPQVASVLQAQGLTQASSPTSNAAEGRINLDIVVTDKSGKPVSGLERKDFTLLDNSHPEKILYFASFDGTVARAEPPVKVILVFDTANHSADQITDIQNGMENFLRQNGGRLSNPVEIYRLTDAGLAVTPQASTDGNALAADISQKRGLREILLDHDDYNGDFFLQAPSPSFRNPSFHPQSPLRALGSIALEERRKPGRKLLVWVGYGGPGDEDIGHGSQFLSRQENRFDWITEFSTQLREARIAFFGVTFWRSPDRRFPHERFLQGVTSSKLANPGNLAFEVLATQSGGRVIEKPDNNLARLIAECVADADVFYTISFNAPNTDQPDDYHDLKVELGEPGLVARTNTGYYDQPVYYDQPFVAAMRVTVNQLEQILAKDRGTSDAELASQLSSVELTERLSSAKLSSWKSRLKGEKARAALVALADASAFLSPPRAEIHPGPPPSQEAQQQMVARTIDYLLKTIPKLPDFFATRTTAHFEEPTPREGQTWKTAMSDRSLHLVGSSQATMLYRQGYEVVELGTKKEKRPERGQERMNTRGTFGPILSVVMADAARSNWVWSRWEQGADA